MKRATIKDIANKAGVSTVTVSKVMNKKGAISKSTTERILKIARKLKYTPDSSALTLVSGKSDVIAIVTPEFTNGFMQQLFGGIQEAAMKSNRRVNYIATGGKGDILESALNGIISSRQAGSVIIVSHQPGEEHIKRLNVNGIKTVLIEGLSENAVSINADNVNGAHAAASYMIASRVKSPGIIVGDTVNISSQSERLKGFSEAFAEKMPGKEFHRFDMRDHSFDDGKRAFHFMRAKGADTVFCAAGDLVAIGFLFEARKNGVKVPEDIRIIGFDDHDLAEGMGLTTVRQDVKHMGVAAFEAACGIENTGTRIMLGTELIIRETA